MNGVSLVICCYNSADKLPPTIQHIIDMRVSDGIPWELIIVDNASTDGTSEIAAKLVSSHLKDVTRIVVENQLGLRNARLKGFEESRYEYICFIDDDNWVCPEWVNIVYEIMSGHPEVGACGGKGFPSFESPPPPWFEQFQQCYAVGPQGESSGYVDSRGFLWGAGLTIRSTAWQEIVENGFSFSLSGRHGTNLSSGEDSEICLALLCYRWRLWYDDRLLYYHYLPSFRLTSDYLKKLTRGFGASEVVLSSYREFINSDVSIAPNFTNIWMKDSKAIIWHYKRKYIRLGHKLVSNDTSSELIASYVQFEKFWTIIKLRNRYDDMKIQIYNFYKNSPLYKKKSEEIGLLKNHQIPGDQPIDFLSIHERDALIQQLQKRIHALESSLSWRLTFPLRKLLDIVKSVSRKP